MAKNMINDILNQLREESNKLLKENKLIYELLDKYRNFSLNLQNICVCNQKTNNDFVVKSLEEEYQRIANKKENVFIKTEVNDIFEIIDTQSIPQNDHKLSEESEGNDSEKSTDCEVIDENDIQFSDEDIDTNERKDFVCDDIGCDQRFDNKLSLSLNSKQTLTSVANKWDNCLTTSSTLENQSEDDSLSIQPYEELEPEESHRVLLPKDFTYKNSAQDMDTTYEVSDGNDTEVSAQEISGENESMVERKDFVCDYIECNEKFKTKLSLILHSTQTHTPRKAYKCKECHKSCISFFHLKQHLRTHLIKPQKKYECEECHKIYTVNHNLIKHKERHHSLGAEHKYNCLECDFKTYSKAGLDIHVKKAHVSEYELIVKCDYEDCHKMFPNKTQMIVHQRTEHTEPGIKCDFGGCSQMFKDVIRMNAHKFNSHIDQHIMCDIPGCGKSFKNHWLMRHHKKRSHTDLQFTCDWPGCGQTYKLINYYKSHMMTHTEDRNIVCTVKGCPKTFHSKEQLNNHMKYHDSKHMCEWPGCESRFPLKRQLAVHMNKHRNLRPFKCTFEGCGKAFYGKETVVTHMKNVHNKKPVPIEPPEPVILKCASCPFETRIDNRLRAHMTTFHSNDELNVKCDFDGCPKMFRSTEHMKKHINSVHTKSIYRCDWPGCEFTTHGRDSIKDHNLFHIGDRNFKCDFEGCAKSFITPKNLRQHRKIHYKRFVCSWPECDERFSEEVFLTAHMNKHLNLRPFKCCFNGCNKDFKIDRHLKHHIRTVHKIKLKDLK